MSQTREVALDDILFCRLIEPFTIRAFYEYLETQLAAETLDFWMSALDLRNMFNPEHPRSSYSMNNWQIPEFEEHPPLQQEGSFSEPPSALSSPVRSHIKSIRRASGVPMHSHTESFRCELEKLTSPEAEMCRRHTEAQILMRSTYVDEDAPLCLNISDAVRVRILEECPKTPIDQPVLDLFDQAMTDCERLMGTNHLQPFLELHGAKPGFSKNSVAPPVRPPAPPRPMSLHKGQRTKEEIASIVPKGPPPVDIDPI